MPVLRCDYEISKLNGEHISGKGNDGRAISADGAPSGIVSFATSMIYHLSPFTLSHSSLHFHDNRASLANISSFLISFKYQGAISDSTCNLIACSRARQLLSCNTELQFGLYDVVIDSPRHV
jgi:hypothetical protein